MKYIKYVSHIRALLAGFLLVFVCSNQLYAQNYGKKILAMYKSTDGYSEKNNPIKWFFESEIKKLGLEIEYHDFDASSPDSGSISDTRAILTWYNSGVVKNKETGIKYVAFLDKALNSGLKLIFVNSFGAYGYKENGKEKWDLIKYINPLFIKMGFNFKGYWTNDPKKLKIMYADKKMVEKNAKQDIKKSLHYQQIIPLRDDVKTYLTVKRLDYVKGIGDGNSSLVLTSKNGGFALEQYVISGNKLMLNAPKFFRESLFYDDGYLDVGVIIGDVKNKEFINKNLNYAFKYAKIRHSVINTADLKSMIAEDLLPYDVILIATETVEAIPVNLCKQYIGKGGHIIFARYAKLNDEYYKLLGLKEYGTGSESFGDGFSIDNKFFLNNISVPGRKIDLSVREAVLKDAKILGKVQDKSRSKKYPVLWEKSYGKGKILYWNTDLLLNNYKGFRGAIVQSIQYIYDGFVTGLANIGMMMIDDFPAPLWNMNYRKYRTEYYQNKLQTESDPEQKAKLQRMINGLKKYSDITDTNFIENIWVKDIEALEKKFGFKYTTYLIFNYNKKTSLHKDNNNFQVIDFYLAENSLPLKMGKKILDNGWELGFHGYNHMSLTLKKPKHYDSKPWPNRETMVKALATARKEWVKVYSDFTLPFAYVAPHNIIDPTGLSALGEAFPSIQIVSTLYSSSQGEEEQEFEWTKDRRFFMIPRMSSGYSTNTSDENLMFDVIHNFGVVSHFVHPDDVFDESRSSGYAGWKWMKSNFEKEFSRVEKCIPSLRWMTVKDAFNEFQFYNATNLKAKKQGKTIIVESSDGSERYLFFRIRLKKGQKIKKTYDCKIVNANYKSGDVILKTNQHLSKIVLR